MTKGTTFIFHDRYTYKGSLGNRTKYEKLDTDGNVTATTSYSYDVMARLCKLLDFGKRTPAHSLFEVCPIVRNEIAQ